MRFAMGGVEAGQRLNGLTLHANVNGAESDEYTVSDITSLPT